MKTTLLAAALIAFAAPAFASSEAPFAGSATVITTPAFSTQGSEGAVMARPATPEMTLMSAAQRLGNNGEAYIGPRG
jgi:hypothetical protein